MGLLVSDWRVVDGLAGDRAEIGGVATSARFFARELLRLRRSELPDLSAWLLAALSVSAGSAGERE